MFKNLLALSTASLLAINALVAQDLLPLVFETQNEWFMDVPADDFGYGSQFIIVDKATGLIRSYDGYELAGEPIQEPAWQTSTVRIPTPFPMLSPLVGGYSTELIIPQTLENRVLTYSPYGYISQTGISVPGIGPEAVFSFPAVATQGQSDPVLLIQTGLNSPPSETRHDALFTSGYSEPYNAPIAQALPAFERPLVFPAVPGQTFDGDNALVALIGNDQIDLYQPQEDALEYKNTKGFPVGGQVMYGDFLVTETSHQLVAYVTGDTNLYLYEVQNPAGSWQLSAPSAYDLGLAISMATRFSLEGKLMVAVHYLGTDEIDIFDLLAEEVVATLEIGDQGSSITGLMSMDGDRLLALSGEGGISAKYELYGSDGEGGLKSIYTGDIPLDGFDEASEASRANIFFFDESPLSSPSATLLGWVSAGIGAAWASEPTIQFGGVQYQDWTDLGASSGLEQRYLSWNSIADGSNVALANQINNTASVVGMTLYGDDLSPQFVSWSPTPGSYDQLEPISVSYPANSALYYRINDGDAWQLYSGAFYPLSDSFTIDYFVESSGGQKGPIKSVNYAFSLSAFNRDSNGDGIPDYVQAALGLDPFGTGDYDQDAASDLDELLAQTSASDASEVPSEGAVFDRGSVWDLKLVSLNIDASPWSIGSVGYIDRLTGARLGQAVVRTYNNQAEFSEIPLVHPEGMLAVSTEERYFCDTDSEGVPTGFENLSLQSITAVDTLDIDVPYVGGSLSDAAKLWLDALEAYAAGPIQTRNMTLGVADTAFALAMEYALEQEFKAQGFMPLDAQLTVFPNRLGDDRWMTISEIAALVAEGNGVTVFSVEDLWTDLDLSASFDAAQAVATNWVEWTDYCTEVYELFVIEQVPQITGQGPVDVLRAILRGETIPTSLLEQLSLDPSEAGPALNEGQGLRASFVREDVQTYNLSVIESNSAGCFVTENAFAQSYSLFDADGERYVSSKTVELLVGTGIRVQAIVRNDITACSGTALEVRSLQVLELPELASSDADGNLLDDNWELFWLGEGEYDPFESIDGSGYSLLQQFLSGNDPLDPTDLPEEAIADLGAPDIEISMSDPNQVTLTWDWPGEYSDLIQFKLIQSDDLGNFSIITPVSVDYNRIGDSHTLVISVPEGDRRFFKLVLSL